MAQGTVLAMMMGPMSLLGVIASWEYVKRDISIVSIAAISYAFFSYFGGRFAYLFDSKNLQFYFAIFLVFLGILYSTPIVEKFSARDGGIRNEKLYISFVGIFIGFIGGFFGIGAGILLVPIFTIFFGMKQNRARAISLAILLPPVSFGGVVQYGYFNSDINWKSALILLISYMVTNGVGNKIGNNHSPLMLRRGLGIVLILSGISIIIMK
jgi:uncharacterized membrane protein YfcA